MYRGVCDFILCLSLMGTFGLQASSASTSNSACQKAVGAFVSLPTEGTLRSLSRLESTGCWSVAGSSNDVLGQLNHWTEQRNPWAAEYLANHLKLLDGGNLEDALIALGQFADHDMEGILLFANKGFLSKRELTDALTMLPLSLSDNPRGQLDLLSARKHKLLHVTRNDLSKQRSWATNSIDDFTSEIRLNNSEEGR